MFLSISAIFPLYFALQAVALPLFPRTFTSLSAADISALIPFTQLARAAYCDSKDIQTWKCGEACASVPDFEATLTGGDGDAVQLFFVGFSTALGSVVVSYQGTDPTQLMSILTDLNIPRSELSEKFFPGLPETGISVHTGFREQYEKSAALVNAEITRLLAEKGLNKVVTIGHSLGGALALLSSLSLTLVLPPEVAVSSVTFGTPRVGNDAFVQFFDQTVKNFKRVNNDNDPVPVIPGRFLGFSHPKGEVHLLEDGGAVACDGNENDVDKQCTIKTVPNVLLGNILDHLVYNDVPLGTIFCF